MSESTIYHFLRDAGMTRAGALGMMGNIGYESAFRSNNVEDRYHSTGRTDEQYTAAVDNGSYSKDQFSRDAYGYGLCQWTYSTRKAGLYDYARNKGVSISDETMQLEYLIIELKRDFSSLFSYLCSCDSMYDATSKVCWQFENPLVKNVDDRYKIACTCANKPFDSETVIDQPAQEPAATPPGYTAEDGVCTPEIRVLKIGAKGNDVSMLQFALLYSGHDLGTTGKYGNGIDADFGSKTETALKQYQVECNLPVTGVCDADTWQVIFQ